MAITVKIEEKEAKEITFPILMKSTDSVLVVLFTNKIEGFIVNSIPGSEYGVGYFADDWPNAFNEQEWEPSPPITLSNS